MRLFEFANDDPLRVKLTALAAQLKAKTEQSNEPMDVKQFLELLANNGINIEKSDIYDLIKKEPLVNIISAIEADKVIFKGQQPELDNNGEDKPGEYEKTRQQMASKQLA